MNIKTFLAMKNIKARDFAKTLGVSSPYLSSIISGREKISMKMALKIHEISKGKVSYYSLRKEAHPDSLKRKNSEK